MQQIDKDKQREYQERIPFVSELLRRIDDVSQAIRQGGSGIEETKNLLSDLPHSLRDELEDDLKRIQKDFDMAHSAAMKQYCTGMPEKIKILIDGEILNIGRKYSRSIKQTVIDMLDSKNLLFLSRKPVPESEFVDMSETRYHD